MSTLDRSFPSEQSNLHLITLGTTLVVGSLLLAGWLLLFSGDIPGGLNTLLLTVSGALFIAIGKADSSRPSA